jgi:penicillin amidase
MDWDGELSRDSAAGALYAVWLQELTERFYRKPRFNKETSESLKTLNHVGMLLAALEQPTEAWFGGEPADARDQLLENTFIKANTRAEKLLGADSSKWRWGALHTVTFRHALAKLGPEYDKAFNLGPVERPGDMNTPNNTRHDENFKQVHGASYRHLFDLADWDHGLSTSTPGQSGQLGSPHYTDLLPLWAEGRYFPLAYSRGKVEDVRRHRLTLTPR